MSSRELCFLSVAEVSRLIAAREVSPVSVVQATLDRIEKLDGTIGAYVTVTAETALQAAREAEGEIARGNYRGPLHGIPVSLKDIIYVKGVRNTAGSRVMYDFFPSYDATVTRKLREAGAIIVGKAQLYEFAMGPKTTYHFGRTRNPWDLDRVTTGSSSGSAAGVSAFLCHASLGSDTGGSIRGPASMCGVVGLKPTYGRVSRYGVVPLSWSLDHVGPLTRTVADCALVMSAIAGYDPNDPGSVAAPVPDYAGSLDGNVRGLRIGVPYDFFFEGMDPEFEEAVRKALGVLESAGASLREVSFPTIEHAQTAHSVILLSEAASVHEERIRTSASLFGSNARNRTETGSFILATDYLKAQRVRALFQREFDSAMKGVDVLVTPTSPGRPPRFDESPPPNDGRSAARSAPNRFRRPFNLVGAPAISIPCGFSSDGIPIGMQIVGKPMEDELVLRVASAYEQLTDWHRRRPPV